VKRLQWTDIRQGIPRTFDQEPDTTPIQRGLLRILRVLPIEEYL